MAGSFISNLIDPPDLRRRNRQAAYAAQQARLEQSRDNGAVWLGVPAWLWLIGGVLLLMFGWGGAIFVQAVRADEKEHPYAKRGFADMTIYSLVLHDGTNASATAQCWTQPDLNFNVTVDNTGPYDAGLAPVTVTLRGKPIGATDASAITVTKTVDDTHMPDGRWTKDMPFSITVPAELRNQKLHWTASVAWRYDEEGDDNTTSLDVGPCSGTIGVPTK